MFTLISGQSQALVGRPIRLVIRYTHEGPALEAGAAVRVGYEHQDGPGTLQSANPGEPDFFEARTDGGARLTCKGEGRVRSITLFPGTGMSDLIVAEVRIESGRLNAGGTIDLFLGGEPVDRAGFVPGKCVDTPFRMFYHADPDNRFAIKRLHPQAPKFRQYITADGASFPDWRPCGFELPLAPDEPDRVDLVVPSVVRVGEEAELRVVVYDRFCNHLTDYDDTIELDDTNPRGISFTGGRFRTGGDGYAVLPVRFTEGMRPTSLRFRLSSRGLCLTNPVRVTADDGARVFWGDLHGHSGLSDGGSRDADFFFTYARRIRGLDFAALADHVFGVAVRGHWDALRRAVADHNAIGRFAAILGYEIMTDGFGHRNIYFPDDRGRLVMADYQRGCGGSFVGEDIPAYRGIWDPEVPKTPTPAETVDALAGQELLWTAHHFGGRFEGEDELLRLFEVCSEWGVSDDVAERNNSNLRVREVFARRMSPGLTGGSDDHRAKAGFMGRAILRGPTTYPSGLTAVLCDQLDRRSVYDALKAKRCYATTGARILLDPHVGRHGTVLDVSVDVAGTEVLDRAAVFKNGEEVWQQFLGTGRCATLRWRDDAFGDEDTCYIRVRQMDGEMAWINPVPWACP